MINLILKILISIADEEYHRECQGHRKGDIDIHNVFIEQIWRYV